MKIKHFVNLLFICKPIKLWPLWDVCRQDNPNHMNHGLAYLTSLMARVQRFQGFVNQMCLVIPWSFTLHHHWYPIGPTQIRFIGILLSSMALVWSHHCWSINHLCSMTLKRFLKSSMPASEIQTKNACLTSIYDFFVKDRA